MSVDGVVRYVLSLPLNFIPVVGTVFFLGYNGQSSAVYLGKRPQAEDGLIGKILVCVREDRLQGRSFVPRPLLPAQGVRQGEEETGHQPTSGCLHCVSPDPLLHTRRSSLLYLSCCFHFYDDVTDIDSCLRSDSFGTVAMALNIIPIVSVVFTLTTAVGAALWASELENKGKTGSAERDTEVTLGDDYGKKEVGGKKEL